MLAQPRPRRGQRPHHHSEPDTLAGSIGAIERPPQAPTASRTGSHCRLHSLPRTRCWGLQRPWACARKCGQHTGQLPNPSCANPANGRSNLSLPPRSHLGRLPLPPQFELGRASRLRRRRRPSPASTCRVLAHHIRGQPRARRRPRGASRGLIRGGGRPWRRGKKRGRPRARPRAPRPPDTCGAGCAGCANPSVAGLCSAGGARRYELLGGGLRMRLGGGCCPSGGGSAGDDCCAPRPHQKQTPLRAARRREARGQPQSPWAPPFAATGPIPRTFPARTEGCPPHDKRPRAPSLPASAFLGSGSATEFVGGVIGLPHGSG